MPSMFSRHSIVGSGPLQGYRVLLGSVLLDDINDDRFISVVNLVAKSFRQEDEAHG